MPQAFQLNAARVTTREFLFENPRLLLPIIWLIKLLRLRVPGSTDDPAIDSPESFVVEETDLPDDVRAAFAPDLAELRRRGFDIAVFHHIPLPHVVTTIDRATVTDGSGTVARLQRRFWAAQNKTRDTRQFETEFTDGRRIITFAGTRDMLTPDSWDFSHRPPCDINELLEQHRERVRDVFDGQKWIIRSEQDLGEYVERQHKELVEFHVARGVFEPVPASVPSDTASSPVPRDVPPEDAAVLEELSRLGQNKVGFASMGWGLAISLVAFAAVFVARQDIRMLWMLIPILIVHESGHWAAMNAFGYKNMRMFFIPFFGAAVSGRNLNVSGWKKAAVALMGPVPSILLSILIAVIGVRFDIKWLVELSLLSLVINLFNLVPILPLDGGQTMQAVVFSRSRFLDVLARLVAVLAFFTLAAALGEWILLGLAIFMAIGIPLSYRLAKLTEDLRDEPHLQRRSPDGTTVPTETALEIMRRLRAGSKVALAPRILAQQTMSVFENLNARPPGALASIALLGVYGGSILIGIVGIGVVALAQAGHLDRLIGNGGFAGLGGAHTPLACDAVTHAPADAAEPPGERTLLIHASDRDSALADFNELRERFRGSEVVLFGQTLSWTPAKADDGKIDPVFAEFEERGRRVQVVKGTEMISLALQATAPAKQATFIEEELAAFTAIPAWLRPLPPWSPEWIDAPEQPRWRTMRKLLQEVMNVPADVADDDSPLWKQRAAAARRRDDKRVAEIDAEMARNRAGAIEAAAEKLEQRHDDADSKKLIEAAVPYLLEMYNGETAIEADFEETEDADGPAGDTEGKRSLLAVRELLGVRPGEAAVPDGDSESEPQSYAWASRDGETLNLNVSASRPGAELVDLVEWLCANGGTDLKYDIWGLTTDLGFEDFDEDFEE